MTARNPLEQAADALRRAEALLIGAGAGMGVDSGLPDFRGPEGFWKAYPAFRGRQFAELSNPRWFDEDPELAWGFFGHRLRLYREAVPHRGFAILKAWSDTLPHGGFVFTSNVDGQFQKAGFTEDRILECHGTIHRLQCVRDCSDHLWRTDFPNLDIDTTTVRAQGRLPRCPHCGGLARPNILMFGDWSWNSTQSDVQARRFQAWLAGVPIERLVVVELGAGTAIPTVRVVCENSGGFVIRINPRDCDPPRRGVALRLGAREALEALDDTDKTRVQEH
jgi:NAD-dependent SIR2 family protein deacetylase